MQLGDLGIELRGEGWNLRGVAGSRRDHHVVGREGGIAGLDQIAGTVSGDRVDLDPASHWERKPLRIGGHVIADLVLGREREAGRWEAHAWQPVELGRREHPQRVPPLPPGIAHAIVRVQDHKGPAEPGQVVPDRQTRLAAADDHRFESLSASVHLVPPEPIKVQRAR